MTGNIVLDGVTLLAVVIALTKLVGVFLSDKNQKFLPLFAIFFSIALSLAGFLIKGELLTVLLGGLITGLTSVGLYSSVKNVGQGIAEKVAG